MTTKDAARVLVLGGPTASGKTGLAIALAQRFDAEIVGADSRQIYRDMPIGTAAPTGEECARAPHHLVAFIDPYERYSAARYVGDAAAAIAAIQARGKRVIVVGGTGFYLRALCGEVELAEGPDPALRARLAREAQLHPVDVLHDWLAARTPQRALAVSKGDPYRIVRALEVELGRSAAAARAELPPRRLPTLRAAGIEFVKMALAVEPTELARRITQRTEQMLNAGLVAEAERIGADAAAADAVGYREALAYTRGWLTWDELRLALTRATRRYAKRQLTWFRAEPGIVWVRAGEPALAERIAAACNW